MYPGIAGKIISKMPPQEMGKGGGYKSYDDMVKLVALSSDEQAVLSKYKSQLVFLEPKAEYAIDQFNNGLYR